MLSLWEVLAVAIVAEAAGPVARTSHCAVVGTDFPSMFGVAGLAEWLLTRCTGQKSTGHPDLSVFPIHTPFQTHRSTLLLIRRRSLSYPKTFSNASNTLAVKSSATSKNTEMGQFPMGRRIPIFTTTKQCFLTSTRAGCLCPKDDRRRILLPSGDNCHGNQRRTNWREAHGPRRTTVVQPSTG